jgi:hypothetical protein
MIKEINESGDLIIDKVNNVLKEHPGVQYEESDGTFAAISSKKYKIRAYFALDGTGDAVIQTGSNRIVGEKGIADFMDGINDINGAIADIRLGLSDN